MKDVDSSYSISCSLYYVLPLNYILCLTDLILFPSAREAFSNNATFF